MLGTFTLGRIFGVVVRVHGLVLAMLAVVLVLGAARGQPVALPLAALLVALLAHELGHALMAMRLGVKVVDVVLWPLGGMARMAEVPERASVEARIAAAGPLANLALAAVSFSALVAFFGRGAIDPAIALTWRSPAAALQVFIAMNLLLGAGNLVPAFPMDGGRLLRAGLSAAGHDWLRATEIAVRIGRWCAFAMIVAAFFTSWILVLVALFVLFEGARELWTVRLRHGVGPFAGRAGRGLAVDLGSLFGGARERATRPAAGEEPRSGEPFAGAAPTGPDAPFGRGAPAPSGTAPDGGFSDEDIRRLESYRGRLRP